MLIPVSIIIPLKKKNQEIQLWVQKRDSKDDLRGLLEFPGGKIEKGEDPLAAGVREVAEEAGVKISADKLVKLNNYFITGHNKTIMLMAYLYADNEANFSLDGFISVEELLKRESEIPPTNKQILLDLKRYFI